MLIIPWPDYKRLSREHTEYCRFLLDDWHNGKGSSDLFLAAEKNAILEVLNLFETLGLRGGVAVVKGRVEIFTIGLPLTDDTALIQIEIANPAL